MKKLFKGLMFGISFIIPGVCSATMALSLNVYYDFLEIVTRFYHLKIIKKHFLLILGIILGILCGVFIISNLYKQIPFILNCCFLAIILINYPINSLSNISNHNKLKKILYYSVGLIFVLIIGMLNYQFNQTAAINLRFVIFIILSGFIVSLALILPGISGALMLVILGMYFPLIDTFKNLAYGIINHQVINSFAIIFVVIFVVSLIVGLFVNEIIVKKMLNRYPQNMEDLINGMILGSIIQLMINLTENQVNIYEIIIGLFILVVIYLSNKRMKAIN